MKRAIVGFFYQDLKSASADAAERNRRIGVDLYTTHAVQGGYLSLLRKQLEPAEAEKGLANAK